MTPYWKFKNRIRKIQDVKIDEDVSVFSSNCTGSLYLHEHHMRFNSPFVNLWIRPAEYITLLSDLDRYLNSEMEFIFDENVTYPVGLLGGDVKIFFQHYKTEQEAVDKWKERCKRINKDKVRVIMVQRGKCSYEDLKNFEQLPYEHKVCFTYKEYPEFKSTYYIRGFEKKKAVGDLFEFESLFSLKKYYDQFDMEAFLNGLYY